MTDRSCKTCCFFSPPTQSMYRLKDEGGTCFRYPQWEPTNAKRVCGEWRGAWPDSGVMISVSGPLVTQ